MKDVFKAVKVAEDVYWVGAVDWAVRDFHGYRTGRGTTYNAYLILDEHVTLTDTVKAPFADEMLARIGSVIDPCKIDYIVSNHAEPDHSGCLARVMELAQPRRVFASANGVKALGEHYGELPHPLEAVGDGEQLSLGTKTLTFVETRMCHWPDSMVSYLHERQMLISQDAFGMHLAGCERFDDQVDQAVLHEEAARYYANILLPLSSFVRKALDRIAQLDIPLKIIAPDHGPIWRAQPGKIVELYSRWAAQRRTNKAVVLYDTMWGSTSLMARAIGEGLAAGGASVRLMPASGVHRSDVAAELLDAGAIAIGSPTMNNQIFPTLADVLGYIKGLRPKGLVGSAFGSFGWSGEATKHLCGMLEQMGVQIVAEPVRVRYSPTRQDLRACYELGVRIGRRIDSAVG